MRGLAVILAAASVAGCGDAEPTAADEELLAIGRAAQARATAPFGGVERRTRDDAGEARRHDAHPDEAGREYPARTAVYALRFADGEEAGRLRVTRSDDRVHVHEESGEEWWFVRNPVDPARLTGFRVLRDEALILRYRESALAEAGVAEAWSRVAQCGLDLRALEELSPDGRAEQAFGHAFRCLVAPGDAGGETGSGRVLEAWWNEELRLPLRLRQTGAGGSWVQEMVALEEEARATDLDPPQKRYPGYVVRDLADHREQDGD